MQAISLWPPMALSLSSKAQVDVHVAVAASAAASFLTAPIPVCHTGATAQLAVADDTARAALGAAIPDLKSDRFRVSAAVQSLDAVLQNCMSARQPVVSRSCEAGGPTASQPHGGSDGTLLQPCSAAARSAPVVAPQQASQQACMYPGLIPAVSQQCLFPNEANAGSNSVEPACPMQRATHFILTSLVEAAAPSMLTSTEVARDVVPKYKHITQNVYTRGVQKPRRRREDDVLVCTCRTSSSSCLAGIPSHRQSSRQQATSKVHFSQHRPTNVVLPNSLAATPSPTDFFGPSAKGCEPARQSQCVEKSVSAVESASEEGVACGSFCLNRQLFIFCDSRSCPYGSDCSNKYAIFPEYFAHHCIEHTAMLGCCNMCILPDILPDIAVLCLFECYVLSCMPHCTGELKCRAPVCRSFKVMNKFSKAVHYVLGCL